MSFDPVICLCSDISEDQICAAIGAGATTVQAIRDRLGANTTCGGCLPDIEELIEDFAPPTAPDTLEKKGNGMPSAVELLARELSATPPPLRSGEQPDWPAEAHRLVEKSQRSNDRTLEQLHALRLQGVPLAYLVDSEPFLGAEFLVEPGVVIPHPATEMLAVLTAKALQLQAEQGEAERLLEIGVGVGVISVSAVRERPAAVAYATELSGAAIRLTRSNAESILGPDQDRVKTFQAYFADNLFSAFCDDLPTGVSVVVSNPPYLIEGDEVSEATKRQGLAHLSYSPTNDPNWFLNEILAAPDGVLADNCSVLMECAEWYLPDHHDLMAGAGWQVEVFAREDLAGAFGELPSLRPMGPTGHRVIHAWRGSGSGLGGREVEAW